MGERTTETEHGINAVPDVDRKILSFLSYESSENHDDFVRDFQKLWLNPMG